MGRQMQKHANVVQLIAPGNLQLRQNGSVELSNFRAPPLGRRDDWLLTYKAN